MRLLKSISSRVIYPLNDDTLDSVTNSNSSSSKLRKLTHTRIRIRGNISVPLLAIVGFPLICALLTVFLLLHITSTKDIILPKKQIQALNHKIDKPFSIGCREVDPHKGHEEDDKKYKKKANAAFVVLARNDDIEGIIDSMNSLERHFNRWYNYPYVFLNDEPHSKDFKDVARNHTKAKVEFGTIDPKDWDFPPWADEAEIEEAIQQQGDQGIKYGTLHSYHKMCRFYSGKFYNHKLLQKYDWYWRVEPDVKFFCDITYDPFLEMERSGKVYGFTILIKELAETVPNLFRQTVGYKIKNKMNDTRLWNMFLDDPNSGENKKQLEKMRKGNKNRGRKTSNDFGASTATSAPLSPGANSGSHYRYEPTTWDELEGNGKVHPDAMNGQVYNLCHFWSNFEIARLDFFRSKEYNDYFEHMDQSGGFWTERWGDAPVHSLAAGLFLEPEQLHYFRDIGYRHTTIQHCPGNAPGKQLPHIPYIPDKTDPLQVKEDEYWRNRDPEVTNGVGCRCRCDRDVDNTEFKEGSCMSRWIDAIDGWGEPTD